MRINTINLQVVRNLGNYESLRLGAEWTPDSNQTLAEAMTAGLAELNETADILMCKKGSLAVGGIVPKDATPGLPKGEAVVNEEQAAKLRHEVEAAEKAAAEQAAQQAAQQEAVLPAPDALNALNMEREGDTREILTLATAKKFNNVLGRIAAGVEITKVFDHFRFGEDALAILRAAVNDTHVTLAFGDSAFAALIKAIETKKDITNICNYIYLADENATNAWNLAIQMCNDQQQ